MLHDAHKFTVEGSTREELEDTLRLLYKISGDKPTGYNIEGNVFTITKYGFDKSKDEGFALPVGTSWETVTAMVWDWLKAAENRDAFKKNNPEPDIDGSTDLGWVVSLPVSSWGDFKKAADISFTWKLYGK